MNPFFLPMMAMVVLKDKINAATLIPLLPNVPPALGFVAAIQTTNTQVAELKAKDDQLNKTVNEFGKLIIEQFGEKKLEKDTLDDFSFLSPMINRLPDDTKKLLFKEP